MRDQNMACLKTLLLFAAVVGASFALEKASMAADPLTQLRNAASAIESRFKQAEKDKSLGRDLNANLVKEVKSDSEEFWQGIKGLKKADTESMSQEDGALRQIICGVCICIKGGRALVLTFGLLRPRPRPRLITKPLSFSPLAVPRLASRGACVGGQQPKTFRPQ